MNQVADQHQADVFLYLGSIDRHGYEAISRLCREEKTRAKVLLVLSTFGGDAHAGYRIARALTHHYGGYSLLVPGLCKSAGTLICLGAGELIMADQAELGPLDVQVRKSDELFDMGSGLDTLQALNYLQDQAMHAFRNYMVDLTVGGGISTRMAAEIASKLVTGLFGPVYGQIDPIRVAEMQRAIEIAYAYGERLSSASKNLKTDALSRLVSNYPSHSFVIDRKEAREIFTVIRQAEGAERELALATYCNNSGQLGGPATVVNLKALSTETPHDSSNPTEDARTAAAGAETSERAGGKADENGH
ncbi:SDH family Clp fold serine proteinase [Candidatus Accumulibacter phosphatis]|uniref:SDH family Clp fold serine proteinase n=1 Tax=Candidatus Accumulibacter phosphatis TaxID=327160 RepID=UPI0039B946F5